MFSVSETSTKLVEAWTSYAVLVGCEADTTRTFADVQLVIGYKQFIRQGLKDGLDMDQISDCWDLVKLQLLSIRHLRYNPDRDTQAFAVKAKIHDFGPRGLAGKEFVLIGGEHHLYGGRTFEAGDGQMDGPFGGEGF